MNFETLYNTVLHDLYLHHSKLENELERLINSDTNVVEKIDNIKLILEQIAISELQIKKWQFYLPDNEDSNTEENGKTE